MYTNVAKPTGSNYTKVIGKGVAYDEATILYDDPSIFYDGLNTLGYTNISKPNSGSYTKITKPT